MFILKFIDMKRNFYLLIIASILISNFTFGQSPTEKTIVFKVKDQYRTYCETDKISIPEFQQWVSYFQLQNIKKVFPTISKPTTRINNSGDIMVDLSLIYAAITTNAQFTTKQVCNQLMNSGLFEYVEQKNMHQLLYTPNDLNVTNQYYLTNIHAFEGWDISKGDSTIVVGISDTGFDFFHSDLFGSVAYNLNDTIDGIDNDNDGYTDNYRGWDLGVNDNNPQITSGSHGLFVSAIVGARADNNLGIAGVGFKTKILPLKITNSNEDVTMGYESIVYGATHGCSIINCSWGGQVTDGKFGEDVINFATNNCNVLVVAACGNSNTIIPFWPASYANVLSVAATDQLDQKSDFSSYGWNVDISAPGSNIYSAIQGNGYTYSGGTSFSAPMVSACAAIVKSYFPNLSAIQIAERLKVTADNIDTITANIPYFGMMGRGRLNLFRALTDTEHPSIKYSNPVFSKTLIQNSDTILFYANFKNLLNPTHNLDIKLSVAQGDLIITNSIVSAPVLQTNESYENATIPFQFIVGNNAKDAEIILKLSYSDNDYFGFEYVKFIVNQSYITVDTNNITTTFTNNSRLGFNNNIFDQGEGFKYLTNNQLFLVGGLVVGKSSDNVSDNIYNDNSYDADFQNVILPYRVIPSTMADFECVTVYNDNGANTNKMNLEVTHKLYAWNQPGCEDFVIHSFSIKNTGVSPQIGLNAGLFIDWDIYQASNNKIKYDATAKMMYAWCPFGGKYGATAMISDLPFTKYAFDNNGANLSLQISDGYSGLDKYTSLTSNRDSAGYSANGNDISSIMSYGSFNLNQNDSVIVNFAVLAGTNPQSLTNSANKAYQKMHPNNNTNINPIITLNNIAIIPNPASTEITLYSNLEQVESIQLYDLMGRKLNLDIITIDNQHLKINVTSLKIGVYFVKVVTKSGEYCNRLVINR